MTTTTQYGLPYMGSKRKLADKLVQYMVSATPDAKHLWDLFGGGGAVSMAALQHPALETVHYNELNPAIASLMRKLQADGVTQDMYQWIDREKFFLLIQGDAWPAGLAQVCWSFGNNQRSYLYGKAKEAQRKQWHDAVMAAGGNSHRNEVLREARKSGRCDLQQLEHLENLERLEHLEHLERLEISSMSYEAVEITTPPESTIIYCDIPYEGTAEYRYDGFNHAAFYEWCEQSPYKIYVSSYDAPMDCVLEMPHKSTLSPTNNGKRTVEKLFCNKPETNDGMLL